MPGFSTQIWLSAVSVLESRNLSSEATSRFPPLYPRLDKLKFFVCSSKRLWAMLKQKSFLSKSTPCLLQIYLAFSFFRYQDATTEKGRELPAFDHFFDSMYNHLETMYKELLAKVSLMAPLLIKVEEILVATRTQRAPRLTSYYLHWEKKLFEAVGNWLFLPQLSTCVTYIFISSGNDVS